MDADLRSRGTTALVVDHRADRAALLSGVLREDGWSVVTAPDGRAAVRWGPSAAPGVVVLAAELPGPRAQTIVRQLRARGVTARFLLCITPQEALDGSVRGVVGRDDAVLVTPVGAAELVAGLRRLAADTEHAPERDPAASVVGDLRLDARLRVVHRGDEPLALSTVQFDLLRFLMERPMEIVSKAAILDAVRPGATDPNLAERHVCDLRKKVDEGRATPMIRTVRGRGYLLYDEAASRPGSAAS